MSKTERRRDVLSSIFTRRGSNGRFTRLFADLDKKQKEVILRSLTLREGELPVIGSVQDAETWFAVTTDKVAWRRGGAVTTLSVHEIVEATVDFRALQASGQRKTEMRELQVITDAGHHTIEVEQGAPLSGVWNVLKNIAGHNRRGRR